MVKRRSQSKLVFAPDNFVRELRGAKKEIWF